MPIFSFIPWRKSLEKYAQNYAYFLHQCRSYGPKELIQNNSVYSQLHVLHGYFYLVMKMAILQCKQSRHYLGVSLWRLFQSHYSASPEVPCKVQHDNTAQSCGDIAHEGFLLISSFQTSFRGFWFGTEEVQTSRNDKQH